MGILPCQTDDKPLLPFHDGPIAPERGASTGALYDGELVAKLKVSMSSTAPDRANSASHRRVWHPSR